MTAVHQAPVVARRSAASPDRHDVLRRRARLAVLVSAQFVVMLDTAIVNVAAPSIQDDLGLTATGTAWVVNVYFLTFGGFLLLAGRAADVLGRRTMFIVGSALFTLATAIAGFAADQSVLVAARALQGVGAAAVSTAALSILLVLAPGAARARAMGAWGAASTLGGATGVLAGGLTTAWLGWSWVFFLTIPVSLAAAVAAPHLLDQLRPSGARRRLDVPGAAAVTGAVLALIYAVLSVADHGWSSVQTLVGLGASSFLLLLFVGVERASADPLVPLVLFRSRSVSVGVVVALLGGAARASTFFLAALYLQQVMLMEPAVAGLAMVPTSVAGFIVSVLLLPRALKVLGPERTLTLGLVVLGTGHLWLARTPTGGGYGVDVLPGLVLAAIGVALSFTPSTMVIASAVPAESSGLAAGLSNAASQIGAALGISAFSAMTTLGAAGGPSLAGGAGVAATGLHTAFTAAAVVALLGALIAAGSLARVLRRHDRRPSGTRSRQGGGGS